MLCVGVSVSVRYRLVEIRELFYVMSLFILQRQRFHLVTLCHPGL